MIEGNKKKWRRKRESRRVQQIRYRSFNSVIIDSSAGGKKLPKAAETKMILP